MEELLIDNENIILKNESIGTLIFNWIISLTLIWWISTFIYTLIININELNLFSFIFFVFSIAAMIYYWIFITIEMYRVITLNKDGYEVKFFFIKKFYFWNEIQTKIIEDFKYSGKRNSPSVKKNVYFCKTIVNKPKKQEPRDYLLYHIYLFSFFSILLTDEETSKEKNDAVNYFRIDENLFKKKMKEWNIEIEEM